MVFEQHDQIVISHFNRERVIINVNNVEFNPLYDIYLEDATIKYLSDMMIIITGKRVDYDSFHMNGIRYKHEMMDKYNLEPHNIKNTLFGKYMNGWAEIKERKPFSADITQPFTIVRT